MLSQTNFTSLRESSLPLPVYYFVAVVKCKIGELRNVAILLAIGMVIYAAQKKVSETHCFSLFKPLAYDQSFTRQSRSASVVPIGAPGGMTACALTSPELSCVQNKDE